MEEPWKKTMALCIAPDAAFYGGCVSNSTTAARDRGVLRGQEIFHNEENSLFLLAYLTGAKGL
jgi:hypothetical protein